MAGSAHRNMLISKLAERFGLDAMFRGVEVGVWCGETSARLLSTFPGLYLMMVDSWSGDVDKTRPQSRFTWAKGFAMNVVRNFEARATVCEATSAEASRTVLNNSVDFVFLDAAHDYGNVARDIACWWPKVRRGGGVMCGHDYGGRHAAGVVPAVDEFAAKMGMPVKTSRGMLWFIDKP